MKPRSLQSAVPVQHGSTSGKGDQSLHIRIGFLEVGKAVSQPHLIAVVESVIEAGRCFVLPDRKWKQPAVLLKLIHHESAKRAGRWAHGQGPVQYGRTKHLPASITDSTTAIR